MINIIAGGKDKEILMLEKAATVFAKKQLAPEREANDAYPFGPFFDTVVQKAFELDFFAVMLPEDLNGMGMGVKAFARRTAAWAAFCLPMPRPSRCCWQPGTRPCWKKSRPRKAFGNVAGQPVGKADQGSVYFGEMADIIHAAAAAMALGVMKGSFKEAFTFSQQRFQGGQEIIKWSELKRIVAEMAIAVQNAEMIVGMACHVADARIPGWELCTRAAALQVQKSACDVTTDGIQVLGGVGYMKDYGQKKRFRDANQIQALLGMAPMKKIRYIESMLKGCKA